MKIIWISMNWFSVVCFIRSESISFVPAIYSRNYLNKFSVVLMSSLYIHSLIQKKMPFLSPGSLKSQMDVYGQGTWHFYPIYKSRRYDRQLIIGIIITGLKLYWHFYLIYKSRRYDRQLIIGIIITGLKL